MYLKHVFLDNSLADGEKYAVAFREDQGIKIIAISEVKGSPDYDIAWFSGADLPEAVPLPLHQQIVALTDDVFPFEYSSTRIEATGNGRIEVIFEPYAHKGNITIYTDKSPFAKGRSFLTSFPALQGASGAPLLAGAESKNFAVAGLLLGNLGRHLIPAQTITISIGDNEKEEIRCFLPMGMAICASVIGRELERGGVNFEYAE